MFLHLHCEASNLQSARAGLAMEQQDCMHGVQPATDDCIISSRQQPWPTCLDAHFVLSLFIHPDALHPADSKQRRAEHWVAAVHSGPVLFAAAHFTCPRCMLHCPLYIYCHPIAARAANDNNSGGAPEGVVAKGELLEVDLLDQAWRLVLHHQRLHLLLQVGTARTSRWCRREGSCTQHHADV